MSLFFASGGQRIGVSTSASVLPVNIQDLFPLGLTGWISLQVQGTLKSVLQHHGSKASILQHSAFFVVQFSHPYMTTGSQEISGVTGKLGLGVQNEAGQRSSPHSQQKSPKCSTWMQYQK